MYDADILQPLPPVVIFMHLLLPEHSEQLRATNVDESDSTKGMSLWYLSPQSESLHGKAVNSEPERHGGNQ